MLYNIVARVSLDTFFYGKTAPWLANSTQIGQGGQHLPTLSTPVTGFPFRAGCQFLGIGLAMVWSYFVLMDINWKGYLSTAISCFDGCRVDTFCLCETVPGLWCSTLILEGLEFS